MIELTDQQQQALTVQAETPPRIVNPRTNERFVLVREDIYETAREILEADRLTEDERRAIIQGVWKRAGWDDPAMDEYAALIPGKSS